MMFESTEPSLMVAACKVLSIRWTWLAFSRVSCWRARVRSRRACSEIDGTKLGRRRPWASRSASHVASFTSVLHVGLASRPGLNMVGVGQHPLKVPRQDGPDRLPVHPGGLHRDARDTMAGQPFREPLPLRGGGGKVSTNRITP